MSKWAKQTEPKHTVGRERLEKALQLEKLEPEQREEFKAHLYTEPDRRK